MKTSKLSVQLIAFLLLFCQTILFSQDFSRPIHNKLIEFHSFPKEVAYLHLNKSSYLNGEQLAFKAYVSTLRDFKPSFNTTNLYVQIKDSTNAVLKEKLILIDKGVGSNLFNIDSTFVGGNYTITAYTNWMRNFDQHHFFQQSFQVLNSNLDSKVKKVSLENIDAQFLPESGHLVANTKNYLGVVVKDPSGFGLSNATVEILNSEKKIIQTTTLDQFGIGKVSIEPEVSEKYIARIRYGGNEFTVAPELDISSKGIVLSSELNKTNVVLQLRTNRETLKDIGHKEYALTLQNANSVKTFKVTFEENTILETNFAFKDMDPGINIFTLWDSEGSPIVERMIFNSENLPIASLKKPKVLAELDTLNFNFEKLKDQDSTFISVSILPKETSSYDSKNSILSQYFLRSYVQGFIEGGDWYFENDSEVNKVALDNLLLTQGWSSYNWKKIFSDEELPKYEFEQHLNVTATANGSTEKERKFIIHASSTNMLSEITLPPGKDSFILEDLTPMEGEDLFISRIKSNGSLVPAGLAIRFDTRFIEKFDRPTDVLTRKPAYIEDNTNNYFFSMNNFGENAEMLDEVLVETEIDPVLERERKLGMHAWGRVNVITDEDKMMFTTLAQYLRSKNLTVQESPRNFAVRSSLSSMTFLNITPAPFEDQVFTTPDKKREDDPDGNGMTLFLDDFPLSDTGML
ncbi:hypothetical protein ACNI3T_05775, partial [Christiangramia sp. ASW11-125]|uniref:hypothetical protein n=1 Tax=Christiangramia sp. ASW11-125 TaxID=3400701 RepID=UPI003AAE856D